MTDPEPQPEPTPLCHLPLPGAVPRDSAVAAETMAAEILLDVTEWAPHATAADAEGMRRRVTVLASIFERRKLSKTATLNVQEAARVCDRASGSTALHELHAGRITRSQMRDMLGTRADNIAILGLSLLPEFYDAIAYGRRIGDLSLGTMANAIVSLKSAKPLPEPEPPPAPPPPHLVTDPTPTILDAIEKIRSIAPVHSADVAALDAAQAKDRARELWDALVPVMMLHLELRGRGKGA